jgi:hypothetical protein
MQHHLMTNGNVLTNHEWVTWVSMQNRSVLHITACSNLNEIVITSNHDFGPDTRVLMEFYFANHFRALGNPSALSQLRGVSV